MAFSTPSPLISTVKPASAQASWEARQQNAVRDAAKLREASQMFEAHFVKLMMSEMRNSIDKSGFMDGGFGEEMFSDSLDQSRADAIAAGRGIGIAEMLIAQLGNHISPRPARFRMNSEQAVNHSSASAAARQDGAEIINSVPGQAAAVPGGSPLWARMDAIKNRALQMQAEASAGDSPVPNFIWPVDGQISSAFGQRFHPILRVTRQHNGIDLKAAHGAPIQASADGRVVFSGSRGQLGRAVIVEHADGSRSVYGHCSRLSVKVGDEVVQGQEIAKVGSTGLATGPHLHFEMRNASGQATNPLISLGSPASAPMLAKL